MPAPILIASLMRPQGETGVQTHVRNVLAWLTGQQRRARLVTPFDCPRWQVYPVFGLRRLLDRWQQEASVWWYRHWHAFFLQRALRTQLRAGQPCVIYAQCPLSARAALRARATPRQVVVMVVHFNLSQADEWADKGAIRRDGGYFHAMRALDAKVLPSLDGLVFVSDFMRQQLRRRIPAIERVPSRVVPNFLDDPGLPTPATTCGELITVGSLEFRKNQRYALEIVHAAALLGRVLKLTVVGDGPDRPMLERLARELGIEGQVNFAGYVPHAASLMSGHQAYLHVAKMESFGITLIEAMAQALPVFAPAAGGMPEVFSDGREGRLIPLDDARAAARLLLAWLDDPSTMQAATQAARQRFLANYTADRVAADLAAFLDEVAKP